LINDFQTAQSKFLESKISGIDGKIGNRKEKTLTLRGRGRGRENCL